MPEFPKIGTDEEIRNAKITKSVVDKLRPASNGEEWIKWDRGDGALKGFGVRIMPSGIASYIIQYRNAHGRNRKLVISRVGVLTPEEAREQARLKLGEVAVGKDPSADRHKLRTDMTVEELCDFYVEKGPADKPDKKASSWKTDKSAIERHIKPLLGKQIASSLTKQNITDFQKDVADGKTAKDTKDSCRKQGRAIVRGGRGIAARSTAVLAAILEFGVGRGAMASNPAKGVERYKGKKKERFLTERELGFIAEAMAQKEAEGKSKKAINGLRLLTLTGCRKEEVFALTWDEVSFEHQCVNLEESKTGARSIRLPAAALEILAGLPRNGRSRFVFPADKAANGSQVPTGHYSGVQAVWKQIRELATLLMLLANPDTDAAELIIRLTVDGKLPSYAVCVKAAKKEGWEFPVGLTNVRIHDLRHSFASFAIAGGASLFMVSKLLGHKQARSSEIYSHLADDPVRKTTNRTGNRIRNILNGGPTKPTKLAKV